MEEIRKQLQSLKEHWPEPEDQTMLNAWEKTANRALVVSNAKSNDGIKIILEGYHKELVECEKALLDPVLFKNSDGLFVGRLLHARIGWCKRFIKIFDTAEKQVEGVKRNITRSFEK